MFLPSFWRRLLDRLRGKSSPVAPAPRRPAARPRLEALEDRLVPSATYTADAVDSGSISVYPTYTAVPGLSTTVKTTGGQALQLSVDLNANGTVDDAGFLGTYSPKLLVQFTVDGQVVSASPSFQYWNGGYANLTFTGSDNVSAGLHTIGVEVAGGGAFGNSLESYGPYAQLLYVTDPNPAATTTSVKSNGPVTFGQDVSITAQASPDVSGSPSFSAGMTGTIKLHDETTGQDLTTFNSIGVDKLTTSLSAGTHTIQATYSGDGNYQGSSGSTDVVINPATPGVGVSVNGGPYTGKPYQATATVTGVNGVASSSLENVSPTLDYRQLDQDGNLLKDLGSTAPTAAGYYDVTASFAGSTDYTSAQSQTVKFTITPAAPTITFGSGGYNSAGNAYALTYDGKAQGASAGVTGVGGASLGSATLAYYAGPYTNAQALQTATPLAGAPTDAGTYTVLASYAGDGQNYAPASAVAGLVIGKADATIQVNGYSGTYDGRPHGLTGSATGVLNEDLSSLLDLGASQTNVGSNSVNWTFQGNTDYKSAKGSASVSITPATPTVSVTDAGGTYNGNPFPATDATVTGVGNDGTLAKLGGANSATLSFTYYAGNSAVGNGSSTAPTDAGYYTVVAHYASNNANYTSADSKPVNFTISNPAPVLSSLDRTSVPESASPSDLTLALTGSGFVPTSVVQWDGTALKTTYVDATHLKAVIPAADLGDESGAQITVFNPGPGGGTSGGLSFAVAEVPLTVGTTATVTALQNVTTGPVALATFSEGAATQAAGHYSASVDWGDGHTDTSAGGNVTISVSGQTISVTGTHTYAATGAQHPVVTLTDDAQQKAATATVNVVADVSDRVSPVAKPLADTAGRYSQTFAVHGGSLAGPVYLVLTGWPASVPIDAASLAPLASPLPLASGPARALTVSTDAAGDPVLALPSGGVGAFFSLALQFTGASSAPRFTLKVFHGVG